MRHDADTTRHDGLEAVTPTEAARRLGITPDAVRARLRRGTLPGEQAGHEWRVFLPPEVVTTVTSDQHDADTMRRVADRDTDTTRHDTDATRHDTDATSPRGNTMPSAALIAAKDETIAAKDETIARQDAEIRFLRERMEEMQRDQAAVRERADVLHREALQRIEALTTGPLPTVVDGHDAPDEPSDAPGREEGPNAGREAHVASWWRRLFGRA